MSVLGVTRDPVVSEEAACLSHRARELDRQAAEHQILQDSTANGYMRRLHGQLAESLRFEASMLRRRRDVIAELESRNYEDTGEPEDSRR
jgi:hypothetical protein